MKNFTAEQIAKARECKTVEELLNLAKENEIEMTEAEATNIFAWLNSESSELSENELEAVASGKNCFNFNKYVENRDHSMRAHDFDSWFEQI